MLPKTPIMVKSSRVLCRPRPKLLNHFVIELLSGIIISRRRRGTERSVVMSVCLFVCLSVCPSVRALKGKWLELSTQNSVDL